MSGVNDPVYGWNGITRDGSPLSLEPVKFGVWAVEYRPELLGDLEDPEWTLPQLYFVMSKEDAEAVGNPAMEGAAFVTIDPPRVKGHQESARLAAEADPEHRDIFLAMEAAFVAGGFD